MKIVIRFVSRTVLYTTLLLLLTAVVAVGGLVWLLFTEPGGRWLLDQVPNLEVEQYSGALGGQWRADRLVYADGETRAVVDAPQMEWRPSCLLRVKVCLDRVHTGSVDVTLPEGDEPATEADEPFELPRIEVPFRLAIEDLALGRLTINEVVAFDRAVLNADLSGSRLGLKRLEVERDTLSASLRGDFQLQGDWPLEAHLNLGHGLGEALDRLRLSSELSGSVAQLRLDAELMSPWQARLEGVVRPLAPGFPARAELSAGRFHYSPDLQETLALRDVVIRAQGDLDSGWDVTGDGVLQTQPGLPVSVAGHVDVAGARVDHLELVASPNQYLRLTGGRVDWIDGFELEASLDWRHFPWLRLWPELDAPPLALERAQMDVAMRGSEYSGELDGQLSTPDGPVHVRTPFEGDFSGINLSRLAVSAHQGRVDGSLTLGWKEVFSWDADLALAALKPGHWVPQLPGELSGTLQSRGSMPEEGLTVDGVVDLQGHLRDQSVRLSAAGEMAGDEWQVRDLDLRFGDNRLAGHGRHAAQLDADLDIALTALEQVWPGLGGRLEGRIDATDLLGNAQGVARLRGDALAWEPEQLRLEGFSLNATLEEALGGEATLDWTGLELGDQEVGSGRIDFQGDERDHRLSLRLEHPMANLELGAEGGWQADHWQGEIVRGAVDAMDQFWLLQSPAALRVDPNDTITLGAHCWGWEEARLCADDQQLYPDQRLALSLNNMPTRIARPWLPPDVRWDESIDGHASLVLGADGPQGTLWLDGGAGRLQVLQTIDPDDMDAYPEARAGETERWVPIHYDRLRAEAELFPERAHLMFDLSGPELGGAGVELELDTTDEAYPVDGKLRLENLDLAIARPFLDLDVIEGQLQGEAQLSGPLRMPGIEGEISLTQGRLSDPRLPLRFDTLELQARVTGERADIEGQWSSGEEGTGEVSGVATWRNGLEADLRVDGERLPVRVEPFARLTVFPALEIRYDGEGLRIGGRVDVPSGEVEVQSLPDTAVRVSEDEEIEGEHERARPLPLRMDLLVVVGEERVRFEGFGVTGNLRGQLRIVDDMEARGELGLVDGRYQIYGQRLTIRQAQLIFSGPLDQPFLDIEAIRQVGEVTAGIRLSGRADEPQAEIFSEPAMSEQQALSYLVFGRPLRSEGDSNVVGEVALALGLAQTAPVTRELGERVGIRDFQLEAEGTGEQASVVASGYITDRLSLRYGVGLFQPVNRIAVRYDLTRQVFLEAASGLADSVDIFYQRDY